MQHADFKDSPSGALKPTIGNQWAFLPNPLPPKIDFAALMEPLQDAAIAIGNLNGSGRQIDNPSLVIRPLQRQEALLSSAMEGTFTTANALALAELEANKADETTREVLNYIAAYDLALKMLEELPISNRVIKAAHERLLSGLGSSRGIGKRPGEFKSHQNFIGGTSHNIEDARFVPPPPGDTEAAMLELERYVNRQDAKDIPTLIDAALVHYQFEAIHPFADGNGRVGRILIPLYLTQKKALELPLLFVSPAVEGRKHEYVDAMLDVSKTGNWTGWITFFLQVITSSCNSTIETINDLLQLRDNFRKAVAESGGSARIATITDQLFTRPVVSIPDAARLMGVTYPPAQNAINKLVELEILEELGGSSHPRRYVCWQVVNATDPFRNPQSG